MVGIAYAVGVRGGLRRVLHHVDVAVCIVLALCMHTVGIEVVYCLPWVLRWVLRRVWYWVIQCVVLALRLLGKRWCSIMVCIVVASCWWCVGCLLVLC